MALVNPSVASTRIVVFGAGGRLGRLVITHALARGHHVRAVVHRANPHQTHRCLELVHADVHDPHSITSQLADVDVVIACLGSAGALRPDVAGCGAATIVSGMSRHGLRRLVSATGTGAALPGEKLTADHAHKRAQMAIGAPHLLRDGEQHLATIAASNLNWTVLRVPLMTRPEDQEPQAYRLGQQAPPETMTITYATGAEAMLDLATDPDRCPQSAPFIHDDRLKSE